MTTVPPRRILITGAGSGLGRALALRCARDGWRVAIADRNAAAAQEALERVRAAGGDGFVQDCDVTSEAQWAALAGRVEKEWGGLDVLVNNAGAISLTSLEDTPVKRFDLMLGINARAVFLTAKLALPLLVDSAKAGRSPHILSLSPPVSAKDGRFDPKWLKGHTAYSLTKYGMTLLTQGFAEELREQGIAVNALWPQTLIATAAVDMLLGDEGMTKSRTPEIMADAAHAIVTTTGLALTGQALIDDRILRARGVTDFAKYLSAPGVEPMPDLYVDPPGAS